MNGYHRLAAEVRERVKLALWAAFFVLLTLAGSVLGTLALVWGYLWWTLR